LGRTLCIPTIFISYTGEALDYKMPLLKALDAVDEAAVPVCNYFDRKVSSVRSTLGWEQEYFLVDEALYNARPDMVMTGRALLGHDPAKGQQLNDHYFGAIPKRVNAFMRDFETEALKLGVPVKTRHNEVAPNQFECAPVFEEANLANDHNQLLMILLESVARRHGFRILFHEKPFLGLNGSGKHNNWSLGTDTGKNLLSPGKNPKENLQFLTFFINTIKAIHDNADILRASIASAGNDHRLGANEAPPAILSVFIGSQLTQVLEDLEKHVKKKGKMTAEEKSYLKLNIGKIPSILKDNTDRNRTSPFAFTGNKFEFRAIGGSSNCAAAMTALNSIVADQLNHFREEVDTWIDKGHKKDEAVLKVLKEEVERSKAIRFEGDNYSEEWVKEAHQRGLSELKDTPRALEVFTRKRTKELFERLDIFTERELDARYEIELENYALKLQIESRVIGDLSQNHIIPTALNYQNRLLQNVQGMKGLFGDKKGVAHTQMELLRSIDEHIEGVKTKVDEMLRERSKANDLEGARERAEAYCDRVGPYFEAIKEHTDALEMLIDDELWPLPKAREILFTR
jgi:glutamine synthetase